MRTLATVALGLLLSVGLVPAPASAELPTNVHRGTNGVMTADWGRILCASNGDGLRCAIRVPEGFSRFDARADQDGLFVDMKAWTYPRVGRIYSKPRAAGEQIVPGVRVACESRGNRYDCTFTLDGRFEQAKINVYSAGVSQGTMDGWFKPQR